MPKLKIRLVIAILLLNLAASTANMSSAHAQNDQLSIIASTTLIADVVGRIAGDTADVTSLMGYGVDPHSYEPSAQDIVALDETDLVFINGANFEGGLISVLEEAAPENIVTISECVPVLPFGDAHTEEVHEHAEGTANELCETHIRELENVGVAIEESPTSLGFLYEANCELGHEHEGEEGEEHEHGSCDPHLWTDVHNVMLWTLMARDVLSEADPANAEIYAANADAYLSELVALDAEVTGLLESVSVENRVLVTNHETLGYLAHRYGYEVVGTVIPGGGTTNEPSAQDVAALIETIQDFGVPAIFTENTVSADLAQQIANETGASIYQLYSDSLTDADGPAPTYLDYMRVNATTIATALTPQ